MLVKATEFKIIQADIDKIAKNGDFVTTTLKAKPTEFSLRQAFRTIFVKAKKSNKTKIIFPALGIKEKFPSIGVAKIWHRKFCDFVARIRRVLRKWFWPLATKRHCVYLKSRFMVIFVMCRKI